MAAYYSENDKHAAAWLRELIKAGLIADGEVDERSIVDVKASDLDGFTQCHFFAGIGGWSLALRLAAWSDETPVWTGSCPCQPFSAAGKQKGTGDKRHLWPEFRRLIAERNPSTVFGEQVASPLGREWLAGVRADLEELGYGVGAADLCAASVGSPHIRQRLWWVGERLPDAEHLPGSSKQFDEQGRRSAAGPVDDSVSRRSGRDAGGVLHTDDSRPQRHGGDVDDRDEFGRLDTAANGPQHAAFRSAWSDFDLIACRDGKARRVEPGLEPLVDGLPGRVGLLRGYGNAIVPQVAAEFIQAFCET